MIPKIEFIRSDGSSFVVGQGDWSIPEDGIKGADAPSYTVYTQDVASGQGQIFTGYQVKSKEVAISAYAKSNINTGVTREQVLNFFNPYFDYKIYATYQNGTRWTQGKISSFECPISSVNSRVEFTVKFAREQEYWKSVDSFGKNIANVLPLWGYPQYFPEVGAAYSTFEFSKDVSLYNEGNFETFMTVTIVAIGQVTNPLIRNGDNYVKIIDVLETGDVYILDFVNNTVTKNGETANGKIDKQSKFTEMGLKIGQNIISYSADDGENEIQVSIEFFSRFGGVV